MNILLLTALAAVCILLAAHPRYPDGLSGRAAFGMIVLACVIMIIGELRDKAEHSLDGAEFALITAVTVFLYRHAYRFLLWAHYGKHAWTASKMDPPVEAK